MTLSERTLKGAVDLARSYAAKGDPQRSLDNAPGMQKDELNAADVVQLPRRFDPNALVSIPHTSPKATFVASKVAAAEYLTSCTSKSLFADE